MSANIQGIATIGYVFPYTTLFIYSSQQTGRYLHYYHIDEEVEGLGD